VFPRVLSTASEEQPREHNADANGRRYYHPGVLLKVGAPVGRDAEPFLQQIEVVGQLDSTVFDLLLNDLRL
jgi:hypothetical protein